MKLPHVVDDTGLDDTVLIAACTAKDKLVFGLANLYYHGDGALKYEAGAVLSTPPIQFAGEQIIHGDTAFGAECKSLLKQYHFLKGWVLGACLLTKTNEWGTVYRTDFEIPEAGTIRGINRAVCWKGDTGAIQLIVSIGQTIPPISP